jgi:hypothetical protein
MFNGYGIPLTLLLFIYIRISRFLHQRSNNQRFIIKRQQKRNLLIIQRIFVNICILFILGIPSVILFILLIITGEEHPFIFRISLLSASLSMEALTISMISFTPLLKNIIF